MIDEAEFKLLILAKVLGLEFSMLHKASFCLCFSSQVLQKKVETFQHVLHHKSFLTYSALFCLYCEIFEKV